MFSRRTCTPCSEDRDHLLLAKKDNRDHKEKVSLCMSLGEVIIQFYRAFGSMFVSYFIV